MANTVSILSYANTFSDWVVITDVLANEVNNLGKATYTKDTGSLILLGTGESLRANGPVNFYSTFNVLGTGSSGFIQNTLTAGSLILNGPASYYANNFTLGAGQANSTYSYINVNRSPLANASIRYNNSLNYWDMLDVTNSTYYRILTTQLLTDNPSTSSSTLAASATNANNLSQYAQAAYGQANTATTNAAGAVNKVNGTSGQALASSGAVTISGGNGVTAVATGSIVTISTPQDLQTTASPTFNGLSTTTGTITTLTSTTSNITTLNGGSGAFPTSLTAPTLTSLTSTTGVATTAYVQTAGQNSQGAKTVQAIATGVPSNSTGNNGDIIYQY